LSTCESFLQSFSINSLCNVFENSIEPIVITDANWTKGIKIIYANRAFCLETGYLKEELINQSPKIL